MVATDLAKAEIGVLNRCPRLIGIPPTLKTPKMDTTTVQMVVVTTQPSLAAQIDDPLAKSTQNQATLLFLLAPLQPLLSSTTTLFVQCQHDYIHALVPRHRNHSPLYPRFIQSLVRVISLHRHGASRPW